MVTAKVICASGTGQPPRCTRLQSQSPASNALFHEYLLIGNSKPTTIAAQMCNGTPTRLPRSPPPAGTESSSTGISLLCIHFAIHHPLKSWNVLKLHVLDDPEIVGNRVVLKGCVRCRNENPKNSNNVVVVLKVQVCAIENLHVGVAIFLRDRTVKTSKAEDNSLIKSPDHDRHSRAHPSCRGTRPTQTRPFRQGRARERPGCIRSDKPDTFALQRIWSFIKQAYLHDIVE